MGESHKGQNGGCTTGVAGVAVSRKGDGRGTIKTTQERGGGENGLASFAVGGENKVGTEAALTQVKVDFTPSTNARSLEVNYLHRALGLRSCREKARKGGPWGGFPESRFLRLTSRGDTSGHKPPRRRGPGIMEGYGATNQIVGAV